MPPTDISWVGPASWGELMCPALLWPPRAGGGGRLGGSWLSGQWVGLGSDGQWDGHVGQFGAWIKEAQRKSVVGSVEHGGLARDGFVPGVSTGV